MEQSKPRPPVSRAKPAPMSNGRANARAVGTPADRAPPRGRSETEVLREQVERGRRVRLLGKVFDFLFHAVITVSLLAVALFWLPAREALVAAAVIFLISAGMIVHVSFSSSQKERIHEAPYHEINTKLFSPVALVFSFAAICYLLNGFQPQLFLGTTNASILDFSVFAVDNILRVVFWDLPEIYGLSATPITHNVDSLPIATFVFLFRALIGLSLIKMLILFLRN
jgi:hypothetical protein